MKIWIDIDNPPHVQFFKPIIKKLEEVGHKVVVTARDYVQTLELLKLHNIEHEVIGTQSGGSKVAKVVRLVSRAFALANFAAGKGFAVGFSHGSRSQVMGCWLVGIPSVVTYDYEFVSTGIFKRFCSKIIVPDCVIEACYNGRHPAKFVGYPGLKEAVYLTGFEPDEGLAERIGIDKSKIIFTIRPPAEKAHYHNRKSEFLLNSVLAHLLGRSDTQVLLVARDAEQREKIKKKWLTNGNAIFLEKAVDGLSLIYHSDAVICGGGTMLREAAVLGVPAYSIFAGKPGAVDSYLAKLGRVIIIKDNGDILKRIRFEKRQEVLDRLENSGLIDFFINQLKSFAGGVGGESKRAGRS